MAVGEKTVGCQQELVLSWAWVSKVVLQWILTIELLNLAAAEQNHQQSQQDWSLLRLAHLPET